MRLSVACSGIDGGNIVIVGTQSVGVLVLILIGWKKMEKYPKQKRERGIDVAKRKRSRYPCGK